MLRMLLKHCISGDVGTLRSILLFESLSSPSSNENNSSEKNIGFPFTLNTGAAEEEDEDDDFNDDDDDDDKISSRSICVHEVVTTCPYIVTCPSFINFSA